MLTVRKLIASSILAGLITLPTITFATNDPSNKGVSQLTLNQVNELARQDIPVANQKLPLREVIINEHDGKILVISENGRFKFEGKITDTWLGIDIDSYESAKYSSEHISTDNIGFDTDMLEPVRVGHGKPVFTVFVNPYQEVGKKFMREIKDYLDDYSFDLIFTPDSRSTKKLVDSFACVSNPKKIRDAFFEGDIEASKDLSPRNGCTPFMTQNRIATFVLLGFDHLPAIIAPSSRISQGDRESGWADFLKNNAK